MVTYLAVKNLVHEVQSSAH